MLALMARCVARRQQWSRRSYTLCFPPSGDRPLATQRGLRSRKRCDPRGELQLIRCGLPLFQSTIAFLKKTQDARPEGGDLFPIDQTFLTPVPNTALSGVALLGNNAQTAVEDSVVKFIAARQKDRGNKAVVNRAYTNTYYINPGAFVMGP